MNLKTADLIRAEYHSTTIRQKELAEKYNTCQRTVSTIVNNKSWMPKVPRPRPTDRHGEKLEMMIVWVKKEDIAKVMAHDKTRWRA